MLPLAIFKPGNTTRKNGFMGITHTYVHPCVINHTPHVVYPRGLPTESPVLFQQLKKYFSALGYRLKEDQRSHEQHAQHSRRRSWAPIMLFSAALLFESSALAEVEITINDKTELNHSQVELNLLSNQTVRQQIRQDLGLITPFDEIEIPSLKKRTAEVLFTILKSRYQPGKNDPAHIEQDLALMADYYSSFPEVVSLFNAVKNADWHLVFDEDNWTTVASGNFAGIDKAEVHFNSRSAAQLRLNDSCKQNPVCIASPADALLHELLHVNSMFNHTEKFLADGAMNGVLYPYQHEHRIIKQERELYQQMTERDQVKRPYRRNHAGRIVKANCATCIK